MKLTYKKDLSSKDAAAIIPVFSNKEKQLSHLPKKYHTLIKTRLKNKEFSAKEKEMIVVYVESKTLPQKVVLLGLGKKKEHTTAKTRNAYARATKKLRTMKCTHVTTYTHPELEDHGQEIGEGIGLADYAYNLCQTGDKKKETAAKKLKAVSYVADKKSKTFETAMTKGFKLCAGVNLVRDLVNGPANIVDEAHMAATAKKLAKAYKYKLKIFEKKDLQKMKMGGILGVNQGSAEGAKLICIEHNPKKSKEDPIVLVGKGVMFDTGGYNLKPSSGMDTMHMDMGGGALVLGVFAVLKELGINKRVIGLVPVTKNMVDANAYKPNDVITTYSGKTVQILNTDAEGRMILIDAIHYAQEKWKPKALINFATLTGACMVALGDRYAGLFGNNTSLIEDIKKSSSNTDEGVWHLPIHPDYEKKMRDDVADLRNIDRGTARLAGASKAAAFLKAFVSEETKWAHLDIAGTAFVNDPKDYDYRYGTGYGVRLMADYLENN